MKKVNEVWRVVSDYPMYQVSSIGRVKSLHGGREFILKTPLSTYGYPKVTLHMRGKNWTIGVHILVARAFIENPLSKPHVNHINAIKFDNRVENLEWTTPLENIRHAKRLGLLPMGDRHGSRTMPHRIARGARHGTWLHPDSYRGENHSQCKITVDDVLDIKSLRSNGKTLAQIANLYNLSFQHVGSICSGTRWKHLVRKHAEDANGTL